MSFVCNLKKQSSMVVRWYLVIALHSVTVAEEVNPTVQQRLQRCTELESDNFPSQSDHLREQERTEAEQDQKQKERQSEADDMKPKND